jgi:protoporphyrinogen oxidase
MDCGADSLDEVSVQNYVDEVCIGNYNHQLKSPYVTILHHLLSSHSQNGAAFPLDQIELSTPITSIHLRPDEKGIDVHAANGKVILADHVIVTVSLGVLKKLQSSMFVPPLSEKKKDVISSMGYGMVGKVVLFYAEPFWTRWKFEYVDGETRALALFWNSDSDAEKNDPQKRYVSSFCSDLILQ